MINSLSHARLVPLIGTGATNAISNFPYTSMPIRWMSKRMPQPARPSRSPVAVQAQRDTWLPGLDPPPHLDGRSAVVFLSVCFISFSFSLLTSIACQANEMKCSLVGDFGFDPLGLGEDPKSLKWYVQAELIHCRFAMAGVAGILFTDVSSLGLELNDLGLQLCRL